MVNLVGLPGVAGGKIENVPMADSVSGAMRALRSSRAATGAGDYGAWTVWKDDTGNFRCDFSRNFSTVNNATHAKKKDVEAWLRTWLPKAREYPQ